MMFQLLSKGGLNGIDRDIAKKYMSDANVWFVELANKSAVHFEGTSELLKLLIESAGGYPTSLSFSDCSVSKK